MKACHCAWVWMGEASEGAPGRGMEWRGEGGVEAGRWEISRKGGRGDSSVDNACVDLRCERRVAGL